SRRGDGGHPPDLAAARRRIALRTRRMPRPATRRGFRRVHLDVRQAYRRPQGPSLDRRPAASIAGIESGSVGTHSYERSGIMFRSIVCSLAVLAWAGLAVAADDAKVAKGTQVYADQK